MRALGMLLVLVAGVTIASTAAAQTNITVQPAGLTAWRINGVNNAPVTVVRGQTYNFNVNAEGHPFYIKTAQVIGAGSQYTVGVTNNGTDLGTVAWVVPAAAPNNLFYQCGVHSSMTGTITVTNAAAPGIGPLGFVALGILLLLAGLVVMRRRKLV